MIPSATSQIYNTILPPSEDFEEALRFKEAMNKPLEVLKAFRRGEELCLTKDHLFEVAIACAQENGRETTYLIQNFGLTDQKHLFEVAIACAQQDGGETAEFIQNFGLTDQKYLFEAAIACARQDISRTVEFLQKFDLTEMQRIEMAKFCAQLDIHVTIPLFQKFELSEMRRFEMAKFCAQLDLYATGQFMRSFCLTKIQLFEMAKFCAQLQALATATNIQKFDLTEEQRFKIAITCAWKHIRAATERIKNFSLTETHRFEMAMACAQKNVHATAEYIQEFDLTETQRLKVAIACARQDGWAVAESIQNFHLTKEQCSEILILAALENPWALKFISDKTNPFKEIVFYLNNSVYPSKEIIERLLAIPTPGLDTSRLASMLQNIEEPEQQVNAIALAAAALFAWTKTSSPQQLEWVSNSLFLDHIFELRAPYLRSKLVQLVRETTNPSHFDQVPGTLPPLLKLPLAKLLAQGVDLSSLNLNERALKDSAVLIPFLETMIALANNETLLPEQKTAVIEAMSQKPFDLARDLLIILNFHRSDLLQTSLQHGLPTLAEEAFRSVLPLPQPVENFSKCYQEMFGDSRGKNALETYAANLNKAADHRIALEALGAHVASVLNRTYLADRYNPENNPHLQFLKTNHPAILQAWQKNSEPQPLQDVLKSDQAASASPSMRDWLREKLIADRHLDLNDYPLLEQLLGDDPEPARNSLIEQRKKDPKSPSIALQLKCYALSKSAAEENTLRLLREIELLVPPSEFQNDVKAKIASLTENQAPADLTIVETDDPEDLLVCGTEIRGSCQRVDGDPSFNRGLVGYLRNGQTRMIAVKDKTGRLAARCLLRLLVDKEGKPVLFLERFYSNLNDSRLYTAIIEKAKQTADRLLCPLTSLEGETDYGSPLRSLGGPAPWEYVDGASGVQESEYTINDIKLLYNPGME